MIQSLYANNTRHFMKWFIFHFFMTTFIRKKLRGDDELDFIEDLLEYLDEQLPKADSDETEEILERAAPILAALLVPMKKKYDKFVEIVCLR